MILEHLSDDTTLESLMKKVKGLEVDFPEEDDYNRETWPQMKTKSFISAYERIKGSDGLWQLSFDNGVLYRIQFNIFFESRSENAYNKSIDICKSVIKINNNIRGMNEMLTASYRRTYHEFKSEVMAEKGIPEGFVVNFADYKWTGRGKTALLSAGCVWPDLMTIEYIEETSG